MNGIDPKFIFWFGVWTNLLTLVAGYGIEHAPPLVAQYAPTVQWFAAVLAQANGVVLTALVGISSTKAGPLVSVPAGVVRPILLVAVILGSLFWRADAARAAENLPAPIIKAPASNFSLGSYPTLNGMIVGLYTEGGGSSVTATAPGVPPASLTTTTAAIGLTLGYMWTPRGGPVSMSIEGDVCGQNFNGNNAGFSVSGPLCFEQRFMVFAPWQNLLAALPSFPNPFNAISAFNFPNGLTPVGNAIAGIGGGFYERDISTAFAGVQSGKVWRVDPEIVFMNVQPLSNGTALRGGVKIDFPGQGKIFGPTPAGFTSATLGNVGVRAFAASSIARSTSSRPR
jgi:hypothetical protein